MVEIHVSPEDQNVYLVLLEIYVRLLILSKDKNWSEEMIDVHRNREFCISILKEYTKSDSLIKHALAVESCVRAYATKHNEDVDYWGNVALLHDFDYEMFPTEETNPNTLPIIV